MIQLELHHIFFFRVTYMYFCIFPTMTGIKCKFFIGFAGNFEKITRNNEVFED